MEDKENNLVPNEEKHECENLTEKVKKIFMKHKKEIAIGGSVILVVTTNIITAKITGNNAYNRGVADGILEGTNKGIDIVMNNSSMLGKGLNAFRNHLK